MLSCLCTYIHLQIATYRSYNSKIVKGLGLGLAFVLFCSGAFTKSYETTCIRRKLSEKSRTLLIVLDGTCHEIDGDLSTVSAFTYSSREHQV